jgi:DNA-binding transcriptional LysR family regulator
MERWQGLEEFVAVADCGGFNPAARRLGVSASHVSRQIQALEARLQTRLFHRSTRIVRLTEAGQAFLHHCRQLQDGYDEALRSVMDLDQTPAGPLRITCAVVYGERFVVPVLNALLSEYPRLRISLDLDNAPRDLVGEGFDLAVRLGGQGGFADARLVASRLAPRRLFLCAAPAYLARSGAPASLAELAQHNCLVGSSDLWAFVQDGRETSLRVRGNWRCNSGQAVLDAALHGLGLCQLPDYYVQPHLRSGALVALLPALQVQDHAVWALCPPRRQHSAKIRLVIERLRSYLETRPEYQG